MISRMRYDDLHVWLLRRRFVAGQTYQYFWIVSRYHGFALALKNVDRNPNVQVVPLPKSQTSRFLWYEDVETGTIRNKYSEYCMEAAGNLHITQDEQRTSKHHVMTTTGWAKKVSQRSLHITSSNTGRFLKFFHHYILQEISNKADIKYPTSPQACCHTTL